MIGASGAIFGILLAFGMLFPNTELYLMFIPIPIKAKYFVLGYGLLELFLGMQNSATDNVAHFAHLGGMLFGFERFMLGLYEQAHTNKEREQANAFDLLVRSYIDKFGERGDTDFTTVSGHIVSLFRRKPGDTAAQRLKLALLMRNTYTDIFRHLI